MKNLKDALLCGLIGILIAFVFFGIELETRAVIAVDQFEIIADRIEKDANQRVTDLISRADAQLFGLQALTEKRTGDALAIIREQSANADIEIAATRSDVNGQLTALNMTLALLAQSYSDVPDHLNTSLVAFNGSVAALNKTVADSLLPASKSLTATFNDADAVISDFPSCEDSVNCPFNLFQGVAKAAEHIAQSGEGIAADAKREADYLMKPQTKMQAFRSWLLTVARIYGAI